MRPLTSAWLALSAWTVLVGPVSAQEIGGCKTAKQWSIDRVTKDHVKLVGQVEVDCGDMSFFADEVEVFSDQDRLVAWGNVVFTSGGSRIAADRLEYNTKTRTGTFYNATGTSTIENPGAATPERSMFGTQEADVYFYGAEIQKTGRQRYRITRGGFTTCVQPTPRWQLTSGSVVLNLDRYAVLTNPLFRVKNVPVLYVPILYYPINKEDRATGFLLPSYGASTIRGSTLSNAFFWAISRSQDATFYHDWFTRTGMGYGAEYRYITRPGSEGFGRFYRLNETQTEYTDSSGNVTTLPARQSYEIRGTMSHRLPANLRLRARADYFSDITVQQTYHYNVYEASRRQRSFSGSVTGAFGAWNLIGQMDRGEYFYGSTSSTVRGSTPRVQVSRSERPIRGSLFYGSLGTEYGQLVAQRKTGDLTVDNGVRRLDLQPRVRVPFTRWPFLTINSSAAWRFTWWSESRSDLGLQVEEPIARTYFEAQSSITGPVFNRIWTRPESRYAQKLKHTIEPFVTVQYVSPIDQFDRYVQIDGVDTVVGNTLRMTYGITNRLFRKPGDGGRSRQIVEGTIGQTYYTDARASAYDRLYLTSYGVAPSKVSPLSILVMARPTDLVNARFRAEYDTKYGAFRTMGADGSIEAGGWLQAIAGWSQRRFVEGLPGYDDPARLDHYLNQATNVRVLNNRVGGTYSFNYDVLRQQFLQQRIIGYYNAQCCGFAVEYQAFDLSGVSFAPVRKDRRLNFSVTLAGIGTFSNFFGALGGGQRPY